MLFRSGVFTSKWAAVNAIVKNHRIEQDEFFSEEEIAKTESLFLKNFRESLSTNSIGRNWKNAVSIKGAKQTAIII